ncbi:hypothetical protein HHK36_007789 [Tetracentron sinense]|uniref:demethylphylloquinone reductase n=1 Tax=Tetracentron sinense TaxID=13715 RepID=A0A834ZNW0_TETSI|nr:hypothetical protein HHK36_007789 [Tetracentron sinense]
MPIRNHLIILRPGLLKHLVIRSPHLRLPLRMQRLAIWDLLQIRIWFSTVRSEKPTSVLKSNLEPIEEDEEVEYDDECCKVVDLTLVGIEIEAQIMGQVQINEDKEIKDDVIESNILMTEDPKAVISAVDAVEESIIILGNASEIVESVEHEDDLFGVPDILELVSMVLLVDQSDRFVFKPMLYEILSGEVDAWEIAPRFSDLLANTSVQFFQDRVKFLRPSDHFGMNGPAGSTCGGTVHLESGLLIEYDWLVLALGAEAKLDIVPGAAEFALPFSTLEDARKVDNKLRALEREKFGKDSSPIRVAVVGCGYSGVELAATVSERLQDKGIVQAINVQSAICPTAPPGNREAALKHFSCHHQVLSSRDVQLLLGYLVRCIRKADKFEDSDKLTDIGGDKDIATEQDHGKLILELQPAERGLENQVLEADLVLWTVGSKPLVPQMEPCDQLHSFPVNARGQAETDETLRVKGHPRIFAVGDSAALRDSNGKILPATAQVAFQQADFAGWNLWAAINDRPLLPFRFETLTILSSILILSGQVGDCIAIVCYVSLLEELQMGGALLHMQGKGSHRLGYKELDSIMLPAVDGGDVEKASFQNLGEMMTLGRNDAAITPSFIDGLTLDGPIGHTARKIAYLIRLPTDEHRVKVGISWLTKSTIDSVALLQSTIAKVLSGS